jgi:hypothetical protein
MPPILRVGRAAAHVPQVTATIHDFRHTRAWRPSPYNARNEAD